jgi:hypothetical protein
MIGGYVRTHIIRSNQSSGLELFMTQLLIILILILLKAVIIYFSYNRAVPALLKSYKNEDDVTFNPIRFEDSVMIAILAIGLLSM